MKIPLVWLEDYVKLNKSPKEIADSFTALGLMLDAPIENGVLDLEHRMDRSDWLSIIGCARDIAALESKPLKLPEGLNPVIKGSGGIEIKVEGEAKNLVRRFSTRVFKNITVQPSPSWLKERLEAYGIESKNNIVDITNYVMLEYGAPMHAQDLEKLGSNTVGFRMGEEGESVVTLLGETVKIDSQTLVMTNGEKPIGIGGIVGGKETGVTNETKNIILDSGNYNQSSIRNTSRRLNIRNESSSRNEKFLHPYGTQLAIERATKLILELAGGECYENEDYYPQEIPLTKMNLRFSRVKTIGGIKIEQDVVKNILQRLDYRILDETHEGSLELEIPYFRTDVLVEDDIVADILRINHYDNIPETQIDAAPPVEVTPEIYTFEEKLRDELVRIGLHEHITNPLVKAGEDSSQVKLANSLNSEANALRTNIYDTLVEVVDVYKKHKIRNPQLFEIGLAYTRAGEKYDNLQETRAVEVVSTSPRKVVYTFLHNLGIDNIKVDVEEGGLAAIYQDELKLGTLRNDSFMLYTKNLMAAEKTELRVLDHILHTGTEDVTIELDINEPVGPTVYKIKQASEKITHVEVVDTFKKETKKAVTFRLFINSEEAINSEEILKKVSKL